MHLLLITTWVRELRKEHVFLHFWVWFFVWTSVNFFFFFPLVPLSGIVFLYLFIYLVFSSEKKLIIYHVMRKNGRIWRPTYLLASSHSWQLLLHAVSQRLKSLTSVPIFPLPSVAGQAQVVPFMLTQVKRRVGPKVSPFNAFDDCCWRLTPMYYPLAKLQKTR